MAAAKTHAGYRQLHVYLRREGWKINHKRLYRIYIEVGLGLRRKRPKRRRSAARRVEQPRPTSPNETWAMDFMHDTMADDKRLRVLTVVDTYTRECVALEVAQSFGGSDVAKILNSAGRTRGGLPKNIRVDNGTEFNERHHSAWGWKPRPTSTPLLDESTSRKHWFRDLAEAQELRPESSDSADF